MSAPHQAFVYKICSRKTWLEARAKGELGFSADDQRDGYMHLSTQAQVAATLAKHFAGQRDLVVLTIPTEQLPAERLRWEPSRGGQLFPHLYAPLPTRLVTQVQDVAETASGHRWAPPPLRGKSRA